MTKYNSLEIKQASRRFILSLLIIGLSMAILIFVIIFAKCIGSENSSLNPETVFTAIIGLVGSWVGAIIAFYYSKDNFEAASKASNELVAKVSQNNHHTTTAKEIMMTTNQLVSITYNTNDTTNEKYKLSVIIEEKFKGNNRLPIFSEDLKPLYILHRSVLDKFISSKFFANKDDDTSSELYLKDLLEVEKIKSQMSAFVTAKETDSLAVVKALMERKVVEMEDDNKNVLVSDAFVTQNGTDNSVALGWISNVMISQKADIN